MRCFLLTFLGKSGRGSFLFIILPAAGRFCCRFRSLFCFRFCLRFIILTGSRLCSRVFLLFFRLRSVSRFFVLFFRLCIDSRLFGRQSRLLIDSRFFGRLDFLRSVLTAGFVAVVTDYDLCVRRNLNTGVII